MASKATASDQGARMSTFNMQVPSEKLNSTTAHDQGCWVVLPVVIFVVIFAMANYLLHVLTQEPPYSVEIIRDYQIPLMTRKYQIAFYVKSAVEFEEKYPVGTSERERIEDIIIKEYLEFARDYCHYEEKMHSQRSDFPTPICDRLQSFEFQQISQP